MIGGAFLTTASHGTDQLIVQRLLAARSQRQSVAALLSSGVAILFQFALFLMIGVMLFVYYRVPSASFGKPDRIFPTFIVSRMPHGISGLLIAAILAAAMSNLSAALNALASTSVIDFYLQRKPASGRTAAREAVAFHDSVLGAGVVRVWRCCHCIASGGWWKSDCRLRRWPMGRCWAFSCWVCSRGAQTRAGQWSACFAASRPSCICGWERGCRGLGM